MRKIIDWVLLWFEKRLVDLTCWIIRARKIDKYVTEDGDDYDETNQFTEDALKHVDCVGAGWRPLVRQLIISLSNSGPLDIYQVKEKFGTLRFYCACTREGHMLVNFAEHLSACICERCGRPGHIVWTRGWAVTVCEDCESLMYDNVEMTA